MAAHGGPVHGSIRKLPRREPGAPADHAMLVALAAINAIVITWAAALDCRHASALARALGVTPGEVDAGQAAAQVLPALAGAVLGIPGGIWLFKAISEDFAPLPSLWSLLALLPGTVVVAAVLTMIPARVGVRRPVAEILQAELAEARSAAGRNESLVGPLLGSLSCGDARGVTTDREIARWRLRSQHLVSPHAGSAAAVVRSLLAVQAENPSQAAWAVACRAQHREATELEALLDQGSVVRTHVLRPTWHFVQRRTSGGCWS